MSQNAVTELLGNVVSLPDVIPVSLRGSLDGPNVTIGTRSQSDGDADAAPTETEKPVDRARDAIRQLLDEEIGGAEKEQSPEQKPEKILRDTLKNMFRR